MCARSASENAVIGPMRRRGGQRLTCLAALARRLDFLQRVAEVGHVLEAAIDRREADVARPCRACRAPASPSRRSARDGISRSPSDSTRAITRSTAWSTNSVGTGRLCSARWKPLRIFVDVEVGARAVGLDDLRQPQLDRLVGREALLAAGAAAAAADRVARLGDARVDDLRFGAAAERALHRVRARSRPGQP